MCYISEFISLVLKSYEDLKCRNYRKLELGHNLTILDFFYLQGEDMLMHKVKTKISVLYWGPFSISKAILT